MVRAKQYNGCEGLGRSDNLGSWVDGDDIGGLVRAGWVGKASFHLTPVVDRLAWHLKQSGQLFMDETRAPVLDPGRGKTKTGYLWALARDERLWAGPASEIDRLLPWAFTPISS